MPASKSLYEAMAKTINQHYREGNDDAKKEIYRLTLCLCTDLKQDNIHFNREKFYKACGF